MKIPTGCVSIDKILLGGLRSETVSLVYGEPETGKTTLAMQCAVNCARQGRKTLFIDCDGTFSARRLTQLASDDFKEIAEQIILMRPENLHEQAATVDRLTEYVAKNFGLVVFDTLTTLYRLEIAESPARTFEINRELNRQIASLAQIARVQKIAILVTSQVRSVFNETGASIEPAGTRVMKFWADTIIFLKPTENVRLFQAILEKSPNTVEPLALNLRIGETGIHDYHN